MIIVAPFAGLAWMIVRAGQLDMIEADRNFILAVLTGSLIATVRVGRTSGSAMTAPIQLATTAIGLSLLAWIGGEPALAQISAVIGLGLAGFFVWGGGGVARAMRAAVGHRHRRPGDLGRGGGGALAGVKFCHEPSAGTAF